MVFADTMFENKQEYIGTIQSAKQKGFLNLAKDLETEYYTTIPVLRDIASQNGFSVGFPARFNHFVWVMEATKQ